MINVEFEKQQQSDANQTLGLSQKTTNPTLITFSNMITSNNDNDIKKKYMKAMQDQNLGL